MVSKVRKSKEEVDPHNFNNDILGGIKAAIERGEEIKDAMMTFYNAGYSKREIEDAARNYVMEKKARESGGMSPTSMASNIKNQKQGETSSLTKGKQSKEIQTKKIIPVSTSIGIPGQASDKELESRHAAEPGSKQIKPGKQVVSKYGEKPLAKKRMFEPITIVLVLLLFLLVVILGSVFLFKAELVEFFNRLFG